MHKEVENDARRVEMRHSVLKPHFVVGQQRLDVAGVDEQERRLCHVAEDGVEEVEALDGLRLVVDVGAVEDQNDAREIRAEVGVEGVDKFRSVSKLQFQVHRQDVGIDFGAPLIPLDPGSGGAEEPSSSTIEGRGCDEADETSNTDHEDEAGHHAAISPQLGNVGDCEHPQNGRSDEKSKQEYQTDDEVGDTTH